MPNLILQSYSESLLLQYRNIKETMRPLRYFLYQPIPKLKQTDIYGTLT